MMRQSRARPNILNSFVYISVVSRDDGFIHREYVIYTKGQLGFDLLDV